jgi:hypothetical protein
MSKLVLVFICIVRLIITVSALILLKNQPIIMLTINIIEPELYMNEHWIVPYNVDILCLPFLFTLYQLSNFSAISWQEQVNFQ